MEHRVELAALTQPCIDNVNAQDFTAYIARIGRVKNNPEKLLRYLINHAHWSPFEHTFVTFKIMTSRAMGRELLRHRSFTFQELSQRYEPIPIVLTPELRAQSLKNRQSSTISCDPLIENPYTKQMELASKIVTEHIAYTQALYEQLLTAGIARECARFILPECTSTTILMSGSLRSWIHFFAVRDHPDAQAEIQEIACDLKQIFLEKFPVIAEAAFASPTSKITDDQHSGPAIPPSVFPN
jgi:thymidylate synthase (FAD)